MIKKIILIALISLSLVAPARAEPVQNTENPIVVELFTSQGCSSCPPADRLFVDLAQQKNIITLSCHVSYWNHLNWKDTLSQDFCDMRQHGYAGVRGDQRIYTPQMIVNGTQTFIGSHESELQSALNKAKEQPLQYIKAQTTDKTSIQLSLPAMPQGSYNLWAYGYKTQINQTIGSGENGGRDVIYANPALSYTNLGKWDGMATSRSFNRPDADIDGIVIFAQKDGYGAMIAAGKLAF